MENLKLITIAATFLIDEQIDILRDQFLDTPDFANTDPFSTRMPGRPSTREITRIQNKIESVEKIKQRGVIAIGDISLVKGGYASYVTNRIHEFADAWFINEEKKKEELKKIGEKRAQGKYSAKRVFGDERFQDDDYERWTDHAEQETLKYFGLSTWEAFIELIASVKNFAFRSARVLHT